MITKSGNTVKFPLGFWVMALMVLNGTLKHQKEAKHCCHDIKFVMIIHRVFLFDTYLTFYV